MYSKVFWQARIRWLRREYYYTLSVEEQKKFLKHIFGSRNKKDYQSFAFWKSKFPKDYE